MYKDELDNVRLRKSNAFWTVVCFFLLKSCAIVVQKYCGGRFEFKEGDLLEEIGSMEVRRRVDSMECGGSLCGIRGWNGRQHKSYFPMFRESRGNQRSK